MDSVPFKIADYLTLFLLGPFVSVYHLGAEGSTPFVYSVVCKPTGCPRKSFLVGSMEAPSKAFLLFSWYLIG